MAQQRRRPLAKHHQPGLGLDEPRREPLVRSPGARPSSPRPAPYQPSRGRGQEPAHQSAPRSSDPAPGNELQLDPATIALSLPVAISIGQMIMDRSLDAMPQVALWSGLVVAWKAASAPGVGRGSVDWLVDSINLGSDLRRRLGVPERLPQVAPAPRTSGAWGFVDGLAADVRNLQVAIRVRRGEVVAGAAEGQDVPATGRTVRLALDPDDADIAAVEALDADEDDVLDAEGDVPDIGLPVVRLEQIADLDNLWVVGPKGSGKTTLLRRLLALRRGRHWALDPHAVPGKWPQCVVVGGGLEFGDIDRQLHAFMDWMRRRYKAQARGEVTEAQCKAARRTMVGDEWRAIRKALPAIRATRDEPAIPSAADRLLDILSQGRKAGLCALVASHADTAESMGVSGEADILMCFDLIIYLGALATERVPAAARMARPAVVFDPEHGAWAQLIIGDVEAQTAASNPPAESRPAIARPGFREEAALPSAVPQSVAARTVRNSQPVADVVLPALEHVTTAADTSHAGESGQPAPATAPRERNGEAGTPDEEDTLLMALLAATPPAAPTPAPAPGSAAALHPQTGAGSGGGEANWTSTTFHDDGRTIHIHNLVAVRGGGGRARRGGRGRRVNIGRMRERAAKYQQVRTLVAEGRSANQIDKAIPGERKQILRLVRQAKAELGA